MSANTSNAIVKDTQQISRLTRRTQDQKHSHTTNQNYYYDQKSQQSHTQTSTPLKPNDDFEGMKQKKQELSIQELEIQERDIASKRYAKSKFGLKAMRNQKFARKLSIHSKSSSNTDQSVVHSSETISNESSESNYLPEKKSKPSLNDRALTVQLSKPSRKSKSYKCNFDSCGKVFTQRTSLRHHMRTHTGERPFDCDFCDRSFATKGNLLDHMRRHQNDKPYQCTCGKSYYRPQQLKQHKVKCKFIEKFDEPPRTATATATTFKSGSAHQTVFDFKIGQARNPSLSASKVSCIRNNSNEEAKYSDRIENNCSIQQIQSKRLRHEYGMCCCGTSFNSMPNRHFHHQYSQIDKDRANDLGIDADYDKLLSAFHSWSPPQVPYNIQSLIKHKELNQIDAEFRRSDISSFDGSDQGSDLEIKNWHNTKCMDNEEHNIVKLHHLEKNNPITSNCPLQYTSEKQMSVMGRILFKHVEQMNEQLQWSPKYFKRQRTCMSFDPYSVFNNCGSSTGIPCKESFVTSYQEQIHQHQTNEYDKLSKEQKHCSCHSPTLMGVCNPKITIRRQLQRHNSGNSSDLQHIEREHLEFMHFGRAHEHNQHTKYIQMQCGCQTDYHHNIMSKVTMPNNHNHKQNCADFKRSISGLESLANATTSQLLQKGSSVSFREQKFTKMNHPLQISSKFSDTGQNSMCSSLRQQQQHRRFEFTRRLNPEQ